MTSARLRNMPACGNRVSKRAKMTGKSGWRTPMNAYKSGLTSRKIEYGVIPPKADGEFVAHMEVVLDTYTTPYDCRYPVLNRDEQPIPLLKETRVPIPATTNHPRRVDYEYERAGTASIFMFGEPLAGWRQGRGREHRAKVDWAVEMGALLRGRYAAAEKVIRVCDNRNTHTIGAFYEAFDPVTARALVRRLEFRHTPKHGSGLNIAENELSARTRQCVHGRRFATIEALRAETVAWHEYVNDKPRGVEWQFRTDDARTKLNSLYPKIKT
ncbi:IS630 family transposase [Gemmata obscuriglobus]|uniref:IS630 family transposase n=2 Tax=Gemmata obscuriglobus TaxID=114 RepID=A0A2Z3GRG2_9BACT|nr:IS630 family transposase [Gemmata obscuriglobus]